MRRFAWRQIIVAVAILASRFPVAAQNDEGFVNFSFDQVDVRTFVKLVGEITDRKFVVSDAVAGKITVVSPRVKKSEVYPLFVSILQSVGCSISEESGISHVVQTLPRITPIARVVGAKENTPDQGLIAKVIRLVNVSASEMRKVLESKVSGGKTGSIGAIEETNHLLITDTADAIKQIERIIAEVDQPGLSRTTELVSLTYASADDVASQLMQALAEGETRGEVLRARLAPVPGAIEEKKRSAVVVAAPHSNSVILVGTGAQIQEMRKIIKMMDVDAPSGRGRLNAIFLKYTAADEAAKSLNALLLKTTDKSRTGEPIRKISIEASVANNALIVDSGVGDFEVVKKLIEQLDRMPQQVHIEVLIAEVSETDSLDLGVEMAMLDVPTKPDQVTLSGSMKLTEGTDSIMSSIQKGIFPRGLSVGVARGSSYPGAVNIDAVRKTGKVKLRSRTSLEAQNNKEATVSIVNEIPVLKSTIQGGTGTTRDFIQNIDRVDVGIKLKLTPYIIMPEGEVRMVLNPSIEAVIDPGPAGTQFAPTIAKREVSTTVTVPDGRTIVIAGLTREDKTKVVRKVPILGSIPLIGILFRQTTDSDERTNLLIFVTPHIVTEMARAEGVMKEWEKKTDLKANEK